MTDAKNGPPPGGPQVVCELSIRVFQDLSVLCKSAVAPGLSAATLIMAALEGAKAKFLAELVKSNGRPTGISVPEGATAGPHIVAVDS